ncbi:hypothetical protein BDZ97DRAFT_1965981 [Flammula alnicola]|nr:hypothetical protein BDZ97DRAFT_1965981 [Flammula alnicola]
MKCSTYQGNVAFKAGDFPTAIGHYTSAILADKTDATYPLNRAAAYLRLGKYEDAERDCTTVLSLSPKNVKALFRRGQARIGMGKLLEAQRDMTDVLLVEPANTSAQDELKKITTLIQNEKAKSKGPISPVQSSLDPAATTKRRRVPIKIIEPTSGPSSISKPKQQEAGPSTGAAKAQASQFPKPQTLAPKTPSTSKPDTLEAKEPPVSRPESFKDAKHARESAKPSRIGGGIFRSSGQNTIFPTRGEAPALASPPSTADQPSPPLSPVQAKPVSVTAELPAKVTTPVNGTTLKAPSTLFDFNKAWHSSASLEEKWELINTIPPTQLPDLCKTSLEPALLVSILDAFLTMMTSTNGDDGIKKTVLEYMENFTRISRFSTLVLFLSRPEKAIAKQVWALLGVEKPVGAWRAVA